MSEGQLETGVEEQVAEEQFEQQVESTDTGVTTEVAAQGGEQDQNYGPIITAEITRREAQLQKKFENQFGSYQKGMERVAKVYGYADVDSYMQALDQYEQEQQIAAEAEKLGVDESVIIEHLAPLKAKLTEYETQMESIRQRETMLKVEQDIGDMKAKYPDFDQYKDRVFDIAIESGYKLEDAYKLATYEDKLANIGKQTEAETIRKLQQNATTSPGALGAESAEHKTGFAAMTKDEQRRMIEEVKAGTRKTF